MGKAKSKRKVVAREAPPKYTPGAQLRNGLAVRQRADMALSTGQLKPAQMPLLLDAFDEAATPVMKHLEPFAFSVWELRSFRASGVVGPTLNGLSKFYGQPVEVLSANPERYLGFKGALALSDEAVDEQEIIVIYCGYRCTSGATLDRHAYFASEEMTALILAGSEGSAEVGVTIADLPSPSGVAYLTQSEGDLVLLWNTVDDLLSVQLVPTTGAQDFIVNQGEIREGWGYRFGDYKYLPIPTAEAELSSPESDSPPTLQNIGGYTPGMPDDAPDWSRKGIYQGWSSEQILAVFLSFTHMLRQGALVDSSTIRTAKSSLSGRRRQPGLVTFLSYRSRSGARATGDDGAPSRVYSHRWTVRGHWKRQWYPSEQRHHPIWISTYIAGPEGAPIKTSDKVTLL
ncbi:hypothetical protein [Rhodococcus qingshengii]|nr:hypothetical protein [Rhodococcus qingshengii]